MLLVADVLDRHRIAMTDEQEALFGIDKLNVPRSSIPAVTHVDYSARIQTVHRETNPRYHALISRFKALHRLPGPRQHQLQRARRADRLHARGCLPLLHGHRDRGARRRQLLPSQGRPGSRARATIRADVRAGLGAVTTSAAFAPVPRHRDAAARAAGIAAARARSCASSWSAIRALARTFQWLSRAPCTCCSAGGESSISKKPIALSSQ